MKFMKRKILNNKNWMIKLKLIKNSKIFNKKKNLIKVNIN